MVDKSIAWENILRVQEAVDQAGCCLRPHVKTHKMPYFTNLQLKAGAAGITCAKVSEAEVMAAGGGQGYLPGLPHGGGVPHPPGVGAAAEGGPAHSGGGQHRGAHALEKAGAQAGIRWEVRLEIDTGARRTGVLREQAVSLAKAVAALPHLRLTGIYTFKSLVFQGQPTTDNEAAGREEAELMYDMAQAIRQEGPDIREISVGSTPTWLQAAQTGLVTEVRPGTYIFGDWMLTQEKCARFSQIAVRLYATVVSTPAPGYAILDGGTKTFPMDIPLDAAPYHYPGYAIPIGADGQPDLNLQLRRMNEEHGILTAVNGAPA